MKHLANHDRAAALLAAGHLLPAVLDTEDICRALHLESDSDAIALQRDAGLPLAEVHGRYFVSREAFRAWLDRRAGALPGPKLTDDSSSVHVDQAGDRQ